MNNLKNIRESKGLSQSQLAEKSGVSVRVLQNYEQGVRDLRSAKVSTVYSLAIALGCTCENLIK